MRAAIYARYSSEEQRHESIADQIDKCKDYCTRQRWQIAAVYSDAAITGATILRPEYQRLLQDAERGMFDVVVVEAVDRLSRRLADLANFHDIVEFRKVKLYATDHGEMNALMIALLGSMAQAYLKDLRAKTKRGLTGKIRAGLSAGSIGYGYRVVASAKGKRIIDKSEAAVVRRIFEDYANGASPRALAARLNAERIPGPKGRPWIDTTIRGQVDRGTGLLNNELYIGKIVWNRCTYERPPGGGKRLARPNPRDQWEISTDESLRIVDDVLWRRVKEKQKAVKTEMGRDENGVALNRAHRAEHLLSGLIFCGECGSTFAMRDARHYVCSNNRSKATCGNDLKVKRADLERVVGDALRQRWMNPETLARLRAEVIAERERLLGTADDERAKMIADLKTNENRIRNVVEGIAKVGISENLAEMLKGLEAEREALVAKLDAFDAAMEPAPAEITDDIEATILERAAEIEQLLNDKDRSEAIEARKVIRGMIDRIVVNRHESGVAEISLEGAIAGVMEAAGLVDRYSLDRALGREKAPEPEGSGADQSVVAGARCQRYLPVIKCRVSVSQRLHSRETSQRSCNNV